MRRLRTVGAVFGASAALDVQQHRALNFVRHVIAAVDKLRPEEEIDERRAVDFCYLGSRPVVFHGAQLYRADAEAVDGSACAALF
jgi:hypothetical protein